MKETVIAFFEESGSPVTWLEPTIIARDTSNATIFSGVMWEVGGWWYSYEINKYNKSKLYLITIDGGNTLEDGNRYQYTSNELDNYPNKADRRGVSSWNIDYEWLAKALWGTKVWKTKEWSYGNILVNIDTNKTEEYFEILTKKIESIKIPDGLSLAEIEKLLKNNDPSNSIISEVKWVIESLNANLLKMQLKLGTEEGVSIAKEINDISIKLENNNTLIKKYWDLPEIIEQYKNMTDILMTQQEMPEKVQGIRSWVNQVLSILRK